MQREPILNTLKPELKALKEAASQNWQALIKHCYSKHPPKANDLPFTIDPAMLLSAENGKSVLKKAILHYHPDKNSTHGTQWQVLCEEIVKLINNKYAAFK